MRWVAWCRESTLVSLDNWIARNAMMTTAMDLILGSPEKYLTRSHLAPEGVGGMGGQAGRAACGVAVPADMDMDPVDWEVGERPPTTPCQRCLKKAATTSGGES